MSIENFFKTKDFNVKNYFINSMTEQEYKKYGLEYNFLYIDSFITNS
jgi:hypothetical protein